VDPSECEAKSERGIGRGGEISARNSRVHTHMRHGCTGACMILPDRTRTFFSVQSRAPQLSCGMPRSADAFIFMRHGYAMRLVTIVW
jgi:hypothetical protein